MNALEIEDAILEHEFKTTHTWADWYWGDVPNDVEIPGLGKVSVEARNPTGEESSFIVLRIDGEDGTTRYFRKSGYGSSYGLSIDGPFIEVQPKQRVVLEFS